MKIIVSLLLCLSLISFCGCEKQQKISNNGNNTQIVVMPDEETKASVNGYKKPTTTKTENDSTNEITSGFVGNKSTKKFHNAYCQYAKQIKGENLETSKLRSDFADKGYTACKKCNP